MCVIWLLVIKLSWGNGIGGLDWKSTIFGVVFWSLNLGLSWVVGVPRTVGEHMDAVYGRALWLVGLIFSNMSGLRLAKGLGFGFGRISGVVKPS